MIKKQRNCHNGDGDVDVGGHADVGGDGDGDDGNLVTANDKRPSLVRLMDISTALL